MMRKTYFALLTIFILAAAFMLSGCKEKRDVVFVDEEPPEGVELLPQEETDAIFEENAEVAGQAMRGISTRYSLDSGCNKSCWPCGTPPGSQTCCRSQCLPS